MDSTLSLSRYRPCWLALSLLVCLALAPQPAATIEGGMGHPMQGVSGDFRMGSIPASSFYARNDTRHQAGRIDGSLKGGRVYAGLDVSSVLNRTKHSSMVDVPAMNGFLGRGAGVPILINLQVSGSASVKHLSRDHAANIPVPNPKSIRGYGNRGGLFDIFLMPVIAGGHSGACHVAMPILFFLTDSANTDKLTDLGMHDFSFDRNEACNAAAQIEVRAVPQRRLYDQYRGPGHARSFRKPAACGPDHRLSLHSALRPGRNRLIPAQTTPDTGSGARLGSFETSGTDMGPIASSVLPVGGENPWFVTKWMHDLGENHSFQMDTVSASFAIKL